MPGWTDLILNPEGIRALYPDPPSLDDVTIHEWRLDRDGPTVIARFDLTDLPARMPEKWARLGHNRVQLEMAFVSVSDLAVRGIASTMTGPLTVTRDGARIVVGFRSPEASVDLVCEFVHVRGISAHTVL
ncbi:MAG TPA: Imm50 family immunity protein [Dermatophilaceae bacterium]|nr:Imm50 family immunity protein [Dermatophilaceae bacterium]